MALSCAIDSVVDCVRSSSPGRTKNEKTICLCRGFYLLPEKKITNFRGLTNIWVSCEALKILFFLSAHEKKDYTLYKGLSTLFFQFQFEPVYSTTVLLTLFLKSSFVCFCSLSSVFPYF